MTWISLLFSTSSSNSIIILSNAHQTTHWRIMGYGHIYTDRANGQIYKCLNLWLIIQWIVCFCLISRVCGLIIIMYTLFPADTSLIFILSAGSLAGGSCWASVFLYDNVLLWSADGMVVHLVFWTVIFHCVCVWDTDRMRMNSANTTSVCNSVIWICICLQIHIYYVRFVCY